jgi:ApaG protein
MSQYQFSVEVLAQYLPEQSSPAQQIYSFAYTITVANTGDIAAQLIARHWIIRDTEEHEDQVKGLGVVGQQPLLQPGEAFRYTSGCRLRTATGSMKGSFFCVAEDGHRFEAPVQEFALDTDQEIAADSDEPRVLH